MESIQLLHHLAQSQSLADITGRMAASPKQRADAASGLYVPIVYFSPTGKGKGGLQLPSFSSAINAERAASIQSFQSVLMVSDSEIQEEKERLALNSTPRFTRWEDVITAFTAGLIPVVCKGNPDRLVDYLVFINMISSEHAKGKHHWPVLLRYIEQTRRKVLYQGIPVEDAEAAARRKVHKLTTMDPLGGLSLDNNLLQEATMLWIAKSNLFSEESVDLNVLNTLFHSLSPAELAVQERRQAAAAQSSSSSSSPSSPHTNQYNNIPHSFPSPSSSSSPSPSPQSREKRGKSSPPPTPHGLTEATTQKIYKNRIACVNHIRNACTEPCPRNLPHLSAEEATKKAILLP